MENELPIDEREREIIHSLIVTMKYHRNTIDRAREAGGMGRTAHRMLMHIARTSGNCSQKEIADHLEISTAAVATTMKKLEADGYILRHSDPSDSRFNRIELTDNGKKIANETDQFFQTVDRAMFVGFSDDELAHLTGYVQRMAQNMRNCECGKDHKE